MQLLVRIHGQISSSVCAGSRRGQLLPIIQGGSAQ